MVQQQQQPSPVNAVPIRGRGPPSTRPSVRRGRFPRPPARLPVPEPSSPGCRSSSTWPPSARISTVAACRGFFRRRPLWLLARRRRSARPRPSTAAAAAASRRPPRAVCAPSAAAVAALLHLHFRGSTSASSPLADPPVAAAPLLRNVRPPACELRPAVNPSIRLLPPVCSSRWSSWLVLQHRSCRLCTGGGAAVGRRSTAAMSLFPVVIFSLLCSSPLFQLVTSFAVASCCLFGREQRKGLSVIFGTALLSCGL